MFTHEKISPEKAEERSIYRYVFLPVRLLQRLLYTVSNPKDYSH